MRTLDLYISKHVVSAILLMICVMLAIDSFLEFVGELSDIGVGHYGVLQALMYVPMQLPMQLYQLFPLAGFLGCLVGLGWLSSSNELTVMRASGIAVKEIGRTVIITAVIMIGLVTFIGEGIAPILLQKSEIHKEKVMGHTTGLQTLQGIWLHQNNNFIDISEVISPTQIQGIYIFHFDKYMHLLNEIFVAQGILVNHTWILSGIESTNFSSQSLTKQATLPTSLNLVFDPKMMYQEKQDPSTAAIWTIAKSIIYSKHTGIITNAYEFAFWQRLVAPFSSIVMICLGIPFVFGSLRTTPMGTRLLVGVIVGFLFYMLNQMFGPFSLVNQFPPFLAATLPTILFTLIYLYMLRHIH